MVLREEVVIDTRESRLEATAVVCPAGGEEQARQVEGASMLEGVDGKRARA